MRVRPTVVYNICVPWCLTLTLTTSRACFIFTRSTLVIFSIPSNQHCWKLWFIFFRTSKKVELAGALETQSIAAFPFCVNKRREKKEGGGYVSLAALQPAGPGREMAAHCWQEWGESTKGWHTSQHRQEALVCAVRWWKMSALVYRYNNHPK